MCTAGSLDGRCSAGSIAPSIGKVEALRNRRSAEATVLDVKQEGSVLCVWEVPVPGVLPSNLLTGSASGRGEGWDSVGHGQSEVEQGSLLIVNGLFYLALDVLPDFGKGSLGSSKLIAVVGSLVLDGKFIVGDSVAEV